MGSATVGVMLGVKKTARVLTLAGKFSGDPENSPSTDDRCGVVGFWVALQNNDSHGAVADIEAPFAVDEIATAKPTAKAYARAKSQWEAFAAWCAAQGKPLDAPRLWIATAEVA